MLDLTDQTMQQVLCEGSRGQLQALTQAVEGCAREADSNECLALCVQALTEEVQRLQQVSSCAFELELRPGLPAAADSLLQADAAEASAAQKHAAEQAPKRRLMQRLIWFHHIKSLTKRKVGVLCLWLHWQAAAERLREERAEWHWLLQHIVAWSAELGLGGFSKPGYPGLIVIEGWDDDVEEFTTRLRALRVCTTSSTCPFHGNWRKLWFDLAVCCSGRLWRCEAINTVRLLCRNKQVERSREAHSSGGCLPLSQSWARTGCQSCQLRVKQLA